MGEVFFPGEILTKPLHCKSIIEKEISRFYKIPKTQTSNE
jgi:hypothetical protein